MATISPGFTPAVTNPRANDFYDFAVLGVRNAAFAGRIDNCGPAGEAAATIQNQIVDETVGWVGVELGP